METLEIVLLVTSTIETIALALIGAIWGNNTPKRKEKRKAKKGVNKNV